MHTITIKKLSIYVKQIEYIGKPKPLKHSFALKARWYIKNGTFQSIPENSNLAVLL